MDTQTKQKLLNPKRWMGAVAFGALLAVSLPMLLSQKISLSALNADWLLSVTFMYCMRAVSLLPVQATWRGHLRRFVAEMSWLTLGFVFLIAILAAASDSQFINIQQPDSFQALWFGLRSSISFSYLLLGAISLMAHELASKRAVREYAAQTSCGAAT